MLMAKSYQIKVFKKNKPYGLLLLLNSLIRTWTLFWKEPTHSLTIFNKVLRDNQNENTNHTSPLYLLISNGFALTIWFYTNQRRQKNFGQFAHFVKQRQHKAKKSDWATRNMQAL